jgi:predicted nucleic acid-binding protein
MSVFVVDASVVIKWFIAEPNTDAARRLLTPPMHT